jgi:hypothetical protein
VNRSGLIRIILLKVSGQASGRIPDSGTAKKLSGLFIGSCEKIVNLGLASCGTPVTTRAGSSSARISSGWGWVTGNGKERKCLPWGKEGNVFIKGNFPRERKREGEREGERERGRERDRKREIEGEKEGERERERGRESEKERERERVRKREREWEREGENEIMRERKITNSRSGWLSG